jgi:hypothetical protein
MPELTRVEVTQTRPDPDRPFSSTTHPDAVHFMREPRFLLFSNVDERIECSDMFSPH